MDPRMLSQLIGKLLAQSSEPSRVEFDDAAAHAATSRPMCAGFRAGRGEQAEEYAAS